MLSRSPCHDQASKYARSGLFKALASFAELELRIAQLPTEKERGDAFEVFVEAYLSTDEMVQAAEVWVIGKVPGEIRRQLNLPSRDYGYDGVFRTKLGELVPYPPFIKYRLCKANPQLCTRLGQPMLYNYTVQRPHKPFDGTDLGQIDTGFQHLRRMDAVSPRTHNALYFAYRAFHTDKWIDSFLLLMSCLEALFSNDTPGAATRAIARRVSSLLGNGPRCTEADVRKLYRLRSDMTHGRVVVDDDARKNLEQLGHLEFVASRCFRELVNTGAFAHYENSLKREQFMRALDVRFSISRAAAECNVASREDTA